MVFARPLAVLGLAGLACAGLSAPIDASAQQIFRSISPEGRVTFSDRPAAGASSTRGGATAAAASAGDVSTLPFELRQAASTYPVTLFSGPDCGPCMQGRTLLTGRGIPFAEKTVSTNEDIEALKRLVGMATLPVLTVGGQQLKGFSELEWTQFLDAAGYPKSSLLPSTYQLPPAAPLVAAHDVKPRPAPAAAAAPAPAPAVAAPPPSGGFQF